MGNCTPSTRTGCEIQCDHLLSEMQHECLGPKEGQNFESDLKDSQAMLNHLLLRASEEGAVEAIIACVERGAYVETRRPFAMSPDGDFSAEAFDIGLTPLMYAAQNGYSAACEALITAKANVNSEDEDGLRPLHFAAMGGNVEVCQLLMQHGADPHSKDLEDRTALDMVPMIDRTTRAQQDLWEEIFVPSTAAVKAGTVVTSGPSAATDAGSCAHQRTVCSDAEDPGFIEVGSPKSVPSDTTADACKGAAEKKKGADLEQSSSENSWRRPTAI